MFREIIPILCCPQCRANVSLKAFTVEKEEITEGEIVCENQHSFPVHDGVLDFGSREQEGSNQWSEYYKEEDYAELDRTIQERKTEQQRMQEETVVSAMVDELVKQKQGFLLDIASGRGMLLDRLIPQLDEEVHLIATDLSFDVLKYDRIKFADRNPGLKIDYIACDATALPVKSETMDGVTSFFGIANMLGLVQEGIQEAARVLKKGSALTDSYIVIRKESQGYRILRDYCAQNDMAGTQDVYVEDTQEAFHEKYFGCVDKSIVMEGIGGKNEVDLLPYEGEWYAEVIFRSKK